MFGQKHVASAVRKALAGLALVLLMTGCGKNVTDDLDATRSPSAHGADISDQVVFNSLSKSYDAFLGVADKILTDGGHSPDRIQSVATEFFASTFAKDAGEYSSAGLRSVGSTVVKNLQLQSWSREANGVRATAYICDDVSGVDVLDRDGATVVSPERDPTTPYEVSFEGGTVDELLVSGKSVWTGADFCDD